MASDFTSYLHLYGALPQNVVTGVVRTACIPEEAERLDKILEGWRKAAESFRKIETTEQGIADNNIPVELKMNDKLKKIENDPLFKNSFSTYPSDFKIVEIDKLIAPQRRVSLDYVELLSKRISNNPTMDE